MNTLCLKMIRWSTHLVEKENIIFYSHVYNDNKIILDTISPVGFNKTFLVHRNNYYQNILLISNTRSRVK